MKLPFTAEDNERISRISGTCAQLAMKGAGMYFAVHKDTTYDPSKLKEALKARLDKAIEEGFSAMQEAMAANMGEVGAMTFQMTMLGAGIEAAKEVAHPIAQN